MFTDIPTEQTNAITDLILSMQSIGTMIWILRRRRKHPMWHSIWSCIFGLLAIASLFGAISHGIIMSDASRLFLWLPIYLALGLTMSLFALAAIGFGWGAPLAKFLMPFAVLVGIGFFGVTQIWSDSFLLFIAYEAAIMLSVTIVYGYCYFRYRSPGSGFLTLGTLTGILAAILDAQPSIHLKTYFEFDEHGIFHLVQMLSLLLMAIGVHRGLGSKYPLIALPPIPTDEASKSEKTCVL